MSIYHKLRLTTLLALVLLARSASAVVPGDVNLDGRVSLGDAVAALQVAVGLQSVIEEGFAAGDVAPNPGIGGRWIGDGSISVADVLVLLRVVAGLDSADRLIPTAANAPIVRLDTSEIQTALADGTEAVVDLPLLFVNAADLTAAGVTLTVSAMDEQAPSLSIVGLERGTFLPGGGIFGTNPVSISPAGTSRLRVAFALPPSSAMNGTGPVLVYKIHVPPGVSKGAQYRFTLSETSFSNKEATAIKPFIADAVVQKP
jgi:hypothetical protein